MKGIVICSLIIAVCFLVDVQGNCEIDGHTVKGGEEYISKCIRYTCHEDGSLTALGCPAYQCAEQIGYREKDLSKPYPECCEGPICKEN